VPAWDDALGHVGLLRYPVKFDLVIDNRQALDALAALRKRGENLRPLMTGIGASLADEIRGSFKSGADPYGNKWKPLKTRAGQPLLDTGRLRNSINYNVTKKDEVVIGTNVFYAPVHQFGATIVPVFAKMLRFVPRGAKRPIFAKKVVVPARPFLPLSGLPPSWEEAVMGQLTRFVEEANQA
jgi:phage virion morphogenesis protein